MSKTFKSAVAGHPRRLHIEEDEQGVNIHVSDPEWGDDYGTTISPSDVPALMLALGEYLPTPEKVREVSYDSFMSVAMEYLGKAVRALEAETARAEERAELEAEAVKLANAGREASVDYAHESVLNFHDLDTEFWIAVARKARELRDPK